jgi:hypothetical protein
MLPIVGASSLQQQNTSSRSTSHGTGRFNFINNCVSTHPKNHAAHGPLSAQRACATYLWPCSSCPAHESGSCPCDSPPTPTRGDAQSTIKMRAPRTGRHGNGAARAHSAGNSRSLCHVDGASKVVNVAGLFQRHRRHASALLLVRPIPPVLSYCESSLISCWRVWPCNAAPHDLCGGGIVVVWRPTAEPNKIERCSWCVIE